MRLHMPPLANPLVIGTREVSPRMLHVKHGPIASGQGGEACVGGRSSRIGETSPSRPRRLQVEVDVEVNPEVEHTEVAGV